jgi:hypothetical protein
MRRRERGRSSAARATSSDFFAFDLASVETYFVAERILKAAPDGLLWIPVPGICFSPALLEEDGRGRVLAEARSRALGLPLSWPSYEPWAVPRAMRAAHRAAEIGLGGGFMCIASRLRFAGGFDLERQPFAALRIGGADSIDLTSLAEAAEDEDLDDALFLAAQRLHAENVRRLPALRLGDRLACGEVAIATLLKRVLAPGERAATTGENAAAGRRVAGTNRLIAKFRGTD